MIEEGKKTENNCRNKFDK